MKIAILGAGAMGSVYGARLAFGGADVTLLDVNGAHLEAVNRDGLHVALDDGAHVVPLAARRPEEFGGPADLIVLFTKVFHTDRALAAVQGLLADTMVLSLQNGIGNIERMRTYAPEANILVGVTTTPAEYLGPGRVASHGAAVTAFHAADGRDRPVLAKIAARMAAGGIDARVDPDIETAIWQKATFNCALNAVAALSGALPGAIGGSGAGQDLVDRLVGEVIAVAATQGVTVRKARVDAMLSHAFEHHRVHEPSMLQDRKAGRPTEIDALNGAVAELGEQRGVPVPANRTVTDLIRVMEAGREAGP